MRSHCEKIKLVVEDWGKLRQHEDVENWTGAVYNPYPVLFHSLFSLYQPVTLQSHRLVVYASVSILIFINSTINIVFYSLFVTRFKVLLFKKLKKCQRIFKSQSVIVSSGSALPEGQSMTTNPDGEKTVFQTDLPGGSTQSKVPACSWEKTG